MNAKLFSATLLVGLLLVGSKSAAIDGLSYPLNRLGWSDAEGCGSIWISKSELNLERWLDGSGLPFAIHFSSHKGAGGDGVLGQGWTLPLFESSLVEESEDIVRWNSPGGQYCFFERRSGSADTYATPDGEWHAKLDAVRHQFRMKSLSGTEFLYENGVIKSCVLSGKKYEWHRNSKTNSIEKITKNSEALIECTYDEGVLKKITFPKVNSWMHLGYQERPVFLEQGAAKIISRISPSLSRLSTSDGREWKFNFTDDLTGTYGAQVKVEIKRPDNSQQWYLCQSNGKIVEDNTCYYNVAEDSRSNLKIETKSKKDGTVESYFFDRASLIEERILPSGSLAKTWLIGTPGKAFYKIRQSQETDKEGNLLYKTKFWYDAAGKLTRLMTESNKAINCGRDVSIINLTESEGDSLSKELQDRMEKTFSVTGKPVIVVSERGRVIAVKEEEASSRIIEQTKTGSTIIVKLQNNEDVKYTFDNLGRLLDAM
jgi:predicted ribosome-associated RNA-binding protein Tma20